MKSGLERQLWIEVRAAELAASMLTSGVALWIREEISGWFGWMGNSDRLARGWYPKSDRWHAGYLAALIWDANRKQPLTMRGAWHGAVRSGWVSTVSDR